MSLLLCGECGDLACGAVTAALRVDGGSVTWSEFLWEDGYSAASEAVGAPSAITFDREAYETTLRSAYAIVADLPGDEPTERPRFLWPWRWGWRLPTRS